jgi:uncharacterized protein (TIGR03083 family)
MGLMTNTTTPLSHAQIAQGAMAEYEAFATLVASLDDGQWRTPSRCDGFDVRDVAGHVIGLAEDVAAGKPGSRNAEEDAASVRDDTPQRAAERLRAALGPIGALAEAAAGDDTVWNAPSGVPDLTLGDGVLLLWYDLYVHADDIRAAIGAPSVAGDGLNASVLYLVGELDKRDFDTKNLPLDDAHAFVMVATGRADASTLGLDPGVNIYAD